MGGLLDAVTQRELDAQRDVVMNERKQSYENRPYGLASETMLAAMYPPDHPYHWPTIGSMADITAASLDDVHQFFRTYYVPNNATLAVAGDVRTRDVERLVTKYFGEIPAGAPVPDVESKNIVPVKKDLVLEDDVQLPRIYIAWHSPGLYQRDDAEMDIAGRVIGDGKASRLYRTLVYDRQVAQSVSAYQSSALMSSTFRITVTAKPGVTLDDLEAEAMRVVSDIADNGITQRELDRARNTLETSFIDSLQHVGGFGGRADQLNHNLFYAGDPGYADHDIARYRAVTTDSCGAAVRAYLLQPAVTLRVIPRGAK
jgi:zinc protease